MLPLLTALILAGNAAQPAATPFPERTFDPAGLDHATLESLAKRGSLVILDNDSKGHPELVTAGTIVDAPPSTVYSVITDYAHFADFMPQVEECTVLKTRADGSKDVEFKLKFKVSVVSQKLQYTVRFHTYVPDEKVAFEYVGGDITSGGGSYVLLPWEDGKKTLLFYSTVSDVSNMGYLTRKLVADQPQMEPALHVSTATVVSGAVKKRAEKLEAKKAAVSGVSP